MKYATILLFVLSIIFQLGCSGSGEKIDRSMVIGVYLANHDRGVDMLTLRDDNTFQRTYTTFKGDQFTDSGLWEFQDGDISRIDFNRFRHIFNVSDLNKAIPEPIFWDTFFHKPLIGGEIKIAINEDEGYWYIKAGPE